MSENDGSISGDLADPWNITLPHYAALCFAAGPLSLAAADNVIQEKPKRISRDIEIS